MHLIYKIISTRSITNGRFEKRMMHTLHIDTIKCKELETIVSGPKNAL